MPHSPRVRDVCSPPQRELALLRTGDATLRHVFTASSSSRTSDRSSPPSFARRGHAVSYASLLDNTTQNVTDEDVYEAFGNLMSSSDSTPNPYKYVGSLGYYATGSSLQYLGYRQYMPEIGRFISKDPLNGLSAEYLYCGSSPTRRVDPSGLAFGITRDDCRRWYNKFANAIDTFDRLCHCVTEITSDAAGDLWHDVCYDTCGAINDPWARGACEEFCDATETVIRGSRYVGAGLCDVGVMAGRGGAFAFLAACYLIAALPDLPWR